MQNMGISVLPHITNALLVTSIFSAGNTYVYVEYAHFSSPQPANYFEVTPLAAHYTVLL